MRKGRIAALAVAFALFAPAAALAAPDPADPKRQTPWGLYLTAAEAAALKAEKGGKALFVDVREPVEIMFTGFTDAVDINIPFLLVNPSKWSADKPVFAMERNREFAASVQKALEERGLDTSAPVILMCRSGGERGAPSAKALEGLGLKSVYVVVDGFEGDTDKNNPKGPWRVVNGWKNSGLPWNYNLDRHKVHIRTAE